MILKFVCRNREPYAQCPIGYYVFDQSASKGSTNVPSSNRKVNAPVYNTTAVARRLPRRAHRSDTGKIGLVNAGAGSDLERKDHPVIALQHQIDLLGL